MERVYHRTALVFSFGAVRDFPIVGSVLSRLRGTDHGRTDSYECECGLAPCVGTSSALLLRTGGRQGPPELPPGNALRRDLLVAAQTHSTIPSVEAPDSGTYRAPHN